MGFGRGKKSVFSVLGQQHEESQHLGKERLTPGGRNVR
jgi:hypothetical protein